ncbi:MAG: hypothetical protein GXN96_01450 [Aquificae bacterium]|nr:hypothetical protein [Aquificota bacterium]
MRKVQVFVNDKFLGKMTRQEAEKLMKEYKAKKTYKVEDWGTYVNIYNINRKRK